MIPFRFDQINKSSGTTKLETIMTADKLEAYSSLGSQTPQALFLEWPLPYRGQC